MDITLSHKGKIFHLRTYATITTAREVEATFETNYFNINESK